MDKINNEVGSNNFETVILPELLSNANLTKDDLNSLKGEVRMAFVSGTKKLHSIDEGAEK